LGAIGTLIRWVVQMGQNESRGSARREVMLVNHTADLDRQVLALAPSRQLYPYEPLRFQ
jgi:hypothetical protein